MPILDVPIIEIVLSYFKRAGISDVTLSLGKWNRMIRKRLRGSEIGIRLHYSVEKEPLGTGGALKLAQELQRRLLGGSRDVLLGRVKSSRSFVVSNGDVITDVRIRDMIRAHRSARADVTILGTPVEDPSRYGLIVATRDRRILEFKEKSRTAKGKGPFLINAGIYIMEPEMLDYLKASVPESLERDLFPELISDGKKVQVYPYEGLWLDIGTIEDYLSANIRLLSDPALRRRIRRLSSRFRSKDYRSKRINCLIHRSADIERSAEVRASVIHDGVRIGEDAEVVRSVLLPGSRIGRGASVADMVIGPKATVVEGARLQGPKAWT